MGTTVFFALCLVLCVAAQTDEMMTNTSVPLPDGRIIGGVKAKIEQFPYQISLSNSRVHSCGGSIIRSNVVVTAAHCVRGKKPQQLAIRAGSIQNNQGGVLAQVQKIIVHPNFNSNTLDKDIAILILTEDLPFNAAIQPIEMAAPGDNLSPMAALIVSGWGATSEGSKSSTLLRYTQVQLINQQSCARSYSRGGGVTSNMICAGAAGRDSCQGDSGGPLVAFSDGKAKLFGIVSWGYGCARPKFPGVYTKVINMSDWVKKNLDTLGL